MGFQGAEAASYKHVCSNSALDHNDNLKDMQFASRLARYGRSHLTVQ